MKAFKCSFLHDREGFCLCIGHINEKNICTSVAVTHYDVGFCLMHQDFAIRSLS